MAAVEYLGQTPVNSRIRTNKRAFAQKVEQIATRSDKYFQIRRIGFLPAPSGRALVAESKRHGFSEVPGYVNERELAARMGRDLSRQLELFFVGISHPENTSTARPWYEQKRF